MGQKEQLRAQLSDFTPEAIKTALHTYSGSIKFVDPIDCDKAPADYLKHKKAANNFFESISLEDGGTISQKLKTPGIKADKFKTLISSILTPEKDTKNLTVEFKQNIEKLNTLRNEYSASAIMAELTTYKADILNKLKGHHAEEATKLDNLFNDPNFITELKSTNLIKDDRDAAPLKEQMIARLKAEHKKLEEEFETTINQDVKKVLEKIPLAARRIVYPAIMRHTRETSLHNKPKRWLNDTKLLDAEDGMRKALEKKIKEKNPPKTDQALGLYQTSGDQNAFGFNTDDLGGIDLEDLEHIQTLTGREIIVSKSKNAKNEDILEFKMAIPALSWYRPYNKKDFALDIRSLTTAMYNRGFDTIRLTISNSDEDVARKQTAVAYEEALKAGFKPEDITMVVIVEGKTKELKGDDKEMEGYLNPTELVRAKETGEKVRKIYDAYTNLDLKQAPIAETQDLKNRLLNMKPDETAAPAPTASHSASGR